MHRYKVILGEGIQTISILREATPVSRKAVESSRGARPATLNSH